MGTLWETRSVRAAHGAIKGAFRMKTPRSFVIVIENNTSMLSTLRRLLQTAGYRFRVFSSLEEVRAMLDETDSPSCAIVDLDLPGGAGLAAQTLLSQLHPGLPVIFVSGHADVPSSVQVMKAGALDLLTTPFNEPALLNAIRDAVAQERACHKEREELAAIRQRVQSLTRRETQVLECLLRGLLNKQTASELGTSEKTIKVHRGRIMKKMGAQSVAQLVQLVMRLRASPESIRSSNSATRTRGRRSVRPLAN